MMGFSYTQHLDALYITYVGPLPPVQHLVPPPSTRSGNGFPVSALVMTRQLGLDFAKGGMEYFNTFGGNAASCAAALATFRVVKEDRLQENAEKVG